MKRERLLDLRSGGGLLLISAALVVVLFWWMVLPVLRSGSRAVGDGRDVESYGFDLSGIRLSRRLLVAAGFPKDGLPSLDAPSVMAGADVAAFNEARRGKYLVFDDRVIGVTRNGESRAYPLRVLNWHEVINDTLGGVPVAVTYHPLCDSAVVFDRHLDGEVLDFGVSGLLYNSNLLMFDRRPGGEPESLWSQLMARAVAGPAAHAGRRLRVLPSSLTCWRRWLERYPGTTVIEPAEALLERYRRDPYGNYRMTGRPRFPVEPLPPEGSGSWMSRVAAYRNADDANWSLCFVDACADSELGARECEPCERLSAEPGIAPEGVIADLAPDSEVIYSAWFAWYAHHPE